MNYIIMISETESIMISDVDSIQQHDDGTIVFIDLAKEVICIVNANSYQAIFKTNN